MQIKHCKYAWKFPSLDEIQTKPWPFHYPALGSTKVLSYGIMPAGTRAGGGGGGSHMKGVGMLVVLLWDVNFGFWYHLGCSGENAVAHM